jgi:glycosyltransferase involved in cell wall biosynthesis
MTETPPLRVLVTVTFNDNQLTAHLLPFVLSSAVKEIILVADNAPRGEIGKVRVITPPLFLSRIVGRALAKTVVCAIVARRARPDWVVGFNLVPHGLNALIAAKVCGAAAMYHQIGGTREWVGGGWDSDNAVLGRRSRPSRVLESALVAAVRRFNLVATMGPRGRGELIARDVDAGKVIVLPAAADLATIDGIKGEDSRYDVICVGELISVKRIGDLIHATSILHETHGMCIQVAVVGAGPMRAELEELASRLGVKGQVEFLGFRSDVHRLVKSSRVFVLPSAYEGLSVALVDAMVSGVAVISSDVGEVRDVVKDGTTGVLYRSGDVAALAAALARLLTDHALRAQLGRSGRNSAFSEASPEALSRRVTAELERRRPRRNRLTIPHGKVSRGAG